MGRLLLLFILVPIAELVLLIELGQRVGLTTTLALIVLTGVLGAWLARWQGLGVLAKIQSEIAEGRLPASQLVDGALILVAGAVLMTPGILTDALGFFCLIPPGRRLLKGYLGRRFERAVQSGRVNMSVDFGGFGRPDPRETRDVTPEPKPKLPQDRDLSPDSGYRFLEHTADAGVEIEAPSPSEVYRLALQALTDCMTVLEKVEAREEHPVAMRSKSLDLLLVDWLQEALFRFETTGFVPRDAELRLTSQEDGTVALEGVIFGEPFDEARHPVKLPIKAVTYHRLAFEATESGYFARVIFDV